MSQPVNRALLTVSTILVVAVGLVTSASGGLAQGGPAITASPTASPNVWTISGTGFEPNLPLRVMAIPCGDLATCLIGGGALEGPSGPIFSPVTTSASGTFATQLDFAGATPLPAGSPNFMVVAFPGSRGLERTDPFTLVPASAGVVTTPTPVGPPTGSGNAEPSAGTELVLFVLAGLAALGTGVTLLTIRRLR